MKKAIKILDILKLDYKSYDDYRFSCFFKWCVKFTEYGFPLRALTNSKELYQWYCQQWIRYVEAILKDDIKPYLEANISDPVTYMNMMSGYPKTIENFYPQVIFEMIKAELNLKSDNAKIHTD